MWGWKDPRTTVTLPFWLTVFPKAKIIHIVRHGHDVANSLYCREMLRDKNSRLYADNCTSLRGAFDLWKLYVHTALKYSEKIEKDYFLLIKYEDLLLKTEDSLNKIHNFLGSKLENIVLEDIRRDNAYKFKSNEKFLFSNEDPLLTILGY